MSNHLNEREYRFGIILKALTFLSASAGVFFQMYSRDFVGISNIFKTFTTQSNIWIGTLCLVFLVLDLKNKGAREYPSWLCGLKFMFTTSILLTYIVFALLLTPFMNIEYLLSPNNLFLHVLTPLFAVTDFLICEKGIKNDKKYITYLPLIMPLLYGGFFSIYYEITNELPVQYFFMDYKTYGWLAFKSGGMGVIYWVLILCGFLLVIGRVLLIIKNKSEKLSTKHLALNAFLIIFSLTVVTFIIQLLQK